MDEQRLRAHEDIIKMERDRDRERDVGDRPGREPYPTNTPHHSNAGSLPIHQPVANRFPGTIHSPGGLLGSHGAPSSSIALGAPSGPGAPVGPIHNESSRQVPHGAQNSATTSQHPVFAAGPHSSVPQNASIGATSGAAAVFGPPLQGEAARGAAQPMPFVGGMPAAHAMAPAPGAMNQGQQPILNVRTPEPWAD